jgi:hypothetical protein
MHACPYLGARKIVLAQLIVVSSFHYKQHGYSLVFGKHDEGEMHSLFPFPSEYTCMTHIVHSPVQCFFLSHPSVFLTKHK